MSYSWYRNDSSIADHPKILALEKLLKQPLALAYVTRLHCWTHRFATSGSFPKKLVDHLEASCRWSGAPGELLSAFLKVGLIDTTRSGYEVHDWPEYQGSLVEKSKRDAKMKREKRAAQRADGAQTARAVRQAGAQPAPAPNLPNETDGRDETRPDETDGRSDSPPLEPPTISAAVTKPVLGVKKNWESVATQLATNLVRRRELAGNLPSDRAADRAALNEWATAWVLKHEPNESQLDVMYEAFNAFVADPWAIERGCALALWASPNVWEPRWNEARAKRATVLPVRAAVGS